MIDAALYSTSWYVRAALRERVAVGDEFGAYAIQRMIPQDAMVTVEAVSSSLSDILKRDKCLARARKDGHHQMYRKIAEPVDVSKRARRVTARRPAPTPKQADMALPPPAAPPVPVVTDAALAIINAKLKELAEMIVGSLGKADISTFSDAEIFAEASKRLAGRVPE